MATLMMVTMAIASSPATAATQWRAGDPAFTPPSATPAIMGVNYHPMWSSMTTAVRATVLDSLQAAGTSWVRIDVAWGTLQPTNSSSYDSYGVNQIDTRIKEIRQRGMKILLMFYWGPAWSTGTTEKNGRPSNPVHYANAAAWVAKRYDGTMSPDLKIDAMELWNEPDLDSFWASSPASTQVSDFATLIKTAGPEVKKANPSLTVVVGAPASVDTDWYRSFYRTPGVVGTYDALGVHPYQSPGDAPPSAYEPQYGKYYLRHIPVLVDLMTSMNDPAKIWATEFGWSTHQNTSSTPNWQKGVTDAQQAQYLLQAAELMASYQRVKAAFWYNARNTDIGDTHFDNYGLSRLDNTPKPAYYAFKCASTGICGDPAVTDPAPPSAPTGLTASAVGTTMVTLSWRPPTDATSYIVIRNGRRVGTTSATTFRDTGLGSSSSYEYTVKAVSAAGTSPASSPLTVRTDSSRRLATRVTSPELANPPQGTAQGMATRS